MPDTKVGKKGRCPRCREVLTVPGPDTKPQRVPLDGRLLDLPEPAQEDQTETTYEQLRAAFGGRIMEREELPERKYPWMVDIFLYPLNRSALATLLICAGVPFFLRLVAQFLMIVMSAIQIMIIFWVISIWVHWVGLLLLVTYAYWYFCQCIRDSAEGQIRAPETLAETPGLAELLGQNLKLIFCSALCLVPAIIHWGQAGDINQVPWILGGAGNFFLTMVLPVEVIRHMAGAEQIIPLVGSTREADPAFWVLWGAGNFVFPMVLLSQVMHESFFSALNPIRIVRSIFRTFFQYIGLALVCGVLSFPLSMIYFLILSPPHWHLAYALLALAFYQMLIMAHLLGRFYFKYDEKLYWDT
ncbi:MAG: hypothetical protein JSW27_02020 [Phycisphaerales bacterium]|nr:MAG: hypothetical protein JSW27_02020 [Phycisphaerales bacterium]